MRIFNRCIKLTKNFKMSARIVKKFKKKPLDPLENF
jgi:hypothetical protein